MENEIPFEEWYSDFKEKAIALDLPELDESIAVLAHMEGLTVDEAIEQYKEELS